MKRLIEKVTREELNYLHESALGMAMDILGDEILDGGSAALSAIPIVGDLGVALPGVIKNLKELQDETEEIHELLTHKMDDTLIEDIEDIQGEILEDLIDLTQRILEMSPDPGATEIASFIGGTIANISRVVTGDEIIKFIGRRDEFIKFIKDKEKMLLTSKIMPKSINPTAIVVDAFDALEVSVSFIDQQDQSLI